MPNLKKQEDEHNMWLTVVREYDKLRAMGPVPGFNHPDATPLVKAIQAWGELLVDLRIDQSEDVRGIARAEALGMYLQVRF